MLACLHKNALLKDKNSVIARQSSVLARTDRAMKLERERDRTLLAINTTHCVNTIVIKNVQ